MSRAVRHLFACLLLVLLPFQALAASFATAEAPIVTCAEMMMEGMDCCDEGACPDASNCMANVAAVALPVPISAAPTFPRSDAALSPVPALHDSFIPDRLQRPPQSFL